MPGLVICTATYRWSLGQRVSPPPLPHHPPIRDFIGVTLNPNRHCASLVSLSLSLSLSRCWSCCLPAQIPVAHPVHLFAADIFPSSTIRINLLFSSSFYRTASFSSSSSRASLHLHSSSVLPRRVGVGQVPECVSPTAGDASTTTTAAITTFLRTTRWHLNSLLRVVAPTPPRPSTSATARGMLHAIHSCFPISWASISPRPATMVCLHDTYHLINIPSFLRIQYSVYHHAEM